MSQGQERISKAKRRLLLKRLKSEIGHQMGSLYKASALSWLQFLMRVVSFYLIARTIHQLYHGQEVSLNYFCLLLIGLAILGYLLSRLARSYQGLASQHARNQLKKKFFDTFEANAGEFDDQFTMSDIMMVASQGIDSLDTYYHHYLSMSFRAYLNCSTILLIMTLIFPLGSLIFILCLPLIPISIIAMQKRSKRIMNHYWATYMDVGNLFMDNLQGMNTLYSYGATESYEKSFAQKAEDFRQSTMTLLRFQLEAVGYMDGVMYLGVGLSGFFAVNALAQGQISLGHLIFLILIAAEFFAPIREMGYGMHLVMMNTKMADRIYTFLDSVTPAQSDICQEKVQGLEIDQIILDKVSFGYDDRLLLDKISAKIVKGEIFAIAGESGLGKTTLAKLLKGRLPLTSGQIYLDQTPLSGLSPKDLEENIIMVSPDSYLFNQSIYDNLTMGKNMSREALLAWLNDKKLLTFIGDLPDGLDTIIGENGSRLSPGQGQQLILTRALLADKPVYLLDEMTSSIDSENEDSLFDLIRLMSEKAIVIFISHKMKQVLKADQVLFMGQLQAKQVGRPEELLASNPDFARLVETQRELEEILHES